MPKDRIVIVGAGRLGKELDSFLSRQTRWALAGYIDDRKPRGPWGSSEILGGLDELRHLAAPSPLHYITATGENRVRRDLVRKIEALGEKNLVAGSIVHEFSSVGSEVEICEGTCLAPGCVLTTHIKIGKHCILNVQVSVSHDCWIGDFVNLNPGAVICGNVTIGEGAYIGAGATVINRITIGEWATVGAGSTVFDDVPPGATVLGVPARVIKKGN